MRTGRDWPAPPNSHDFPHELEFKRKYTVMLSMEFQQLFGIGVNMDMKKKLSKL